MKKDCETLGRDSDTGSDCDTLVRNTDVKRDGETLVRGTDLEKDCETLLRYIDDTCGNFQSDKQCHKFDNPTAKLHNPTLLNSFNS